MTGVVYSYELRGEAGGVVEWGVLTSDDVDAPDGDPAGVLAEVVGRRVPLLLDPSTATTARLWAGQVREGEPIAAHAVAGVGA